GARPSRRRRRAARVPDGALEGRERRSRGDEAADAETARRAGAAVLHLHVRPGGRGGALPHDGREGPGDHPGAARVDLWARRPALRDRRAGGRWEDPAPARVRGVDQRRRGGAAELRRPALRLPAARPRGADSGRLARHGCGGDATSAAEPRGWRRRHISCSDQASELRVTSFCRLAAVALLCPCGLVTPASAQRLDTGERAPPVLASGAAAERYEPVFEALRKLAPRGDSVATV